MTSPGPNGNGAEPVKGEIVGHEPELDPWERQDGEGPEAYEAFRTYLQIRSTRKVGHALGKDGSLIRRWSANHGWQHRAMEWDRDQARLEAEAQHEAMRAMKHRQADAAATMHEIAYRGAKAILRKIRMAEREGAKRFPDDPDRAADLAAILFPLDEDAILKYATMGQQLERQARGADVLEPSGATGGGLTLGPVERAIVTDPQVRAAARELVERAARAREGLAGRLGPGN